MKQITFEEAKQIRLEIVLDIDKFCRAHNIKYFLAFGTLLGAVRHKGFIPWDDDMDIMMPRPEMERFINEYKGNEHYEVISNKDGRGLFYGFARVLDKRTCTLEGRWALPGVNVEIYPIDGAPATVEDQEAFFAKQPKYRKRERIMIWYVDALLRRNLWPFKKIQCFVTKYLCNKYEQYVSTYSYNESAKCIILSGNPYKLKAIDKQVFEKSIDIEFEGFLLSAPIGTHDFLTIQYNDYMQLPPIDKRVPSHGAQYFWM